MEMDLTVENIEKAALDGASLALRVVHDAAEHLGVAVSGLLNIMNPSLVVVGGDLAALGDLLISPLREKVQQRTIVNSMAAAGIKSIELGPQSVAV